MHPHEIEWVSGEATLKKKFNASFRYTHQMQQHLMINLLSKANAALQKVKQNGTIVLLDKFIYESV